ncbi:hypothetical protein ABPG74_003780 [Tetrahymena malaccensis]
MSQNQQLPSSNLQESLYEYCVVGAGPAGICAIAKILERNVNPKKILWIDPQFQVGAFGREWAGVPGNTSVESYIKVNQEIFKILNKLDSQNIPKFDIDAMPLKATCALEVAAEPMQYITERFLKIVCSQRSIVKKISRTNLGWALLLENGDNAFSNRIILSVGVKSRTVDLPKKESQHIKIVPVEEIVDEQRLKKISKGMKKVAVIGSSHTAALATMHLLQAGLTVCQFINAPYKYAQPITLNNQKSTLFDNTGLKGQVAEFTKKLTTDLVQGQYKKTIHFFKSDEQNLKKILPKCSHLVFAIGFEPNNTIQIEDYFDQNLTHDPLTSILRDGIFGIGISYPLQQLNCGILEYQVGYGKFWNTINDYIINIWASYPIVSAMEFQQIAHRPMKSVSENQTTQNTKTPIPRL